MEAEQIFCDLRRAAVWRLASDAASHTAPFIAPALSAAWSHCPRSLGRTKSIYREQCLPVCLSPSPAAVSNWNALLFCLEPLMEKGKSSAQRMILRITHTLSCFSFLISLYVVLGHWPRGYVGTCVCVFCAGIPLECCVYCTAAPPHFTMRETCWSHYVLWECCNKHFLFTKHNLEIK